MVDRPPCRLACELISAPVRSNRNASTASSGRRRRKSIGTERSVNVAGSLPMSAMAQAE
jgi:hypothetical protein